MPFFYNSCNCRNKIICIETSNFARNRLFYVWKDPLIHMFKKKLKEDPEISLQILRTQLGFVLICWIAHTTAVVLCLVQTEAKLQDGMLQMRRRIYINCLKRKLLEWVFCARMKLYWKYACIYCLKNHLFIWYDCCASSDRCN